jgi:hypothetical protein
MASSGFSSAVAAGMQAARDRRGIGEVGWKPRALFSRRTLGSWGWKLVLVLRAGYGALQILVRTDEFRAQVEDELSAWPDGSPHRPHAGHGRAQT